jgi:hypothetical protein
MSSCVRDEPLKTQTITSHYANYHCFEKGEIAEMCRLAYGYLHATPQAFVNTTKCITRNMLETFGVRTQYHAPWLQRVVLRAFVAIKRIDHLRSLIYHLSSSLLLSACLLFMYPSCSAFPSLGGRTKEEVCGTIKTPCIALRARRYTKKR